MSLEEEKEQLNTAIEKNDEKAIIGSLERLGAVSMTVSLLKETSIGIVVNSLRKHTNETVRELGRQLTTQWKALVSAPGRPSTPSTPTPSPSAKKATSSSPEESQPRKVAKTDIKSEVSTEKKQESKPETKVAGKAEAKAKDVKPALPVTKTKAKREGWILELGRTGDPMRNKIQKLLYDTISPYEQLPPEVRTETMSTSREEVAVRVEDKMFRVYQSTGKEYREKYRSMKFNLSDRANAQLLANLYHGVVYPEEIVEMEESDLASSTLKEQRKADKQWCKDAARSDYSTGLEGTDIYRCEACGKSRTKYFQMQTRGADEPMTVFVTCLECGHKWKDGDNDGGGT